MADLIFNKYEIQTRLAIGGMGEVFYAVQKGVPGFERPAILKSLLPDLASQDGFIEQFLDEARVAATLNHPNVVSIFEVGLWNGVYFIAMEYIQGRNIAQLVKAALRAKQPVPPVVAARIAHDAALGLHHAHTAVDGAGQPLHIVHRDISPQNIMVRDDGVTKVVDFGIARASNRSTRTATGAIKGKLAYMAPEQLLSEPLSSATDQFALGVVLWEMACGQRLFQSDQELVLMKKVLESKVLPPSTVVPGLPPEIDAITMRMLERDPKRRYGSCTDVAHALDQFLVSQSGGGGREARVAAYLKVLGPAEPAMPLRATPSGAKPNFVISLGKEQDEKASRLAETRAANPSPAAVMTRTATVPRSRTGLLSLGALVLAMVSGAAVVFALRHPSNAPAAPVVAPPVAAAASAPVPAPVLLPTPSPPPVAAPEPLKPGKLALKSSPPGAAVRLDGRPVGTTPLELSLSATEPHFLTFEKPGFRRDEREVEGLRAGESTVLEVKLAKAQGAAAAAPAVGASVVAAKPADGPGFLTLSTEPWTKVSVAGEPLGSTPLYKARLGAGKQTLTLVNEGAGINTTRVVTIKPGEVTRLELKLP